MTRVVSTGLKQESVSKYHATQALLNGEWKTCIREIDHSESRHVWLESFARIDGRPIVVVWTENRSTSPVIGEVHLSDPS